MTFPIRINRYLYLQNICSRRQADRFIEKGWVLVNGQRAVIGQKIVENDHVELTKDAKKHVGSYVYHLLNKPVGFVSHNPQSGERDAAELIKSRHKLAPVGRLDKASHGLMLFTNDGRIIDKMLNPKFVPEKEYIVKVNRPLDRHFKRKMESGIDIGGYITKRTKVTVLGQSKFRITLTEGKKHQIRKMVRALDYEVTDLKRTRIMNLRLGRLPLGRHRTLTKQEKKVLLERVLF